MSRLSIPHVRARWPDAVRRRYALSPGGGDCGTAVVEFVMITILLVFLLFAVIQIAAVFYVRNVVAASAADGARYAAVAGAQPQDGSARASGLIATGLSGRLGAQVPCTSAAQQDALSGLAVVEVQCSGRIRSILLPFAALARIHVAAHSLKEAP